MTEIPGPSGASQTPDTRSETATPRPWLAPTWLDATRSAIDDAISAGLDATRRVRNRVLSRAEARRKIKTARRALHKLFQAAEQGPPPPAR